MYSLISPEYSLEIFCNHMHGKNPIEVMDSAGTEIGLARRHHRETTKDSDFRKGSRGRIYSDNLQKLISMLMNGCVPTGSSPEFLASVKPLIQGLLQKWDIGTLRQVFSNLQTPILKETKKTDELTEPEVETTDPEEIESPELVIKSGGPFPSIEVDTDHLPYGGAFEDALYAATKEWVKRKKFSGTATI